MRPEVPLFTIVVALAVLAGAHEAVAAPVVALVTRETTERGGDGVTRITRYQERMYRDGDQLWIERVGAVRARARDAHDLDLRLAARWITRANAGVRVALVSDPDAVVVELEAASLDSLAIPARWIEAASLVDITTMTRGRDGSYVRADAHGTIRVRWNDRLQLPTRIDTQSRDGRVESRVTVAIEPSSTAPWLRAHAYRHIDRSDLSD